MREWIGPEDPEGEARGFTEAAAKSGRGALLVLYDIPHRDCGQYSRGRAADGAACRTWLAGVARGIGDRAATVILEPDALLPLVDGCTSEEFQEECYDLLAGAVTSLAALKNTRVQLDAGNAGWALGETRPRTGRKSWAGWSRPVQWSGWSSQSSRTSESGGAAPSMSAARIRCGSCESGER